VRKLLVLLLFPALTWAAAPTVDDTATYDAAGSGSSHAVTIPNPCTSGKTLLMFFSSDDGADTATEPSGWTALTTGTAGSSRGSIFYKDSNGSEGSTATVTISASENAAAITHCIGGAADPDVTAPEATRNNTGSPSTTPNPPTRTPSGGSDDYLYLVYVASNQAVTTSVYPTGYSGGTTQAATTGGNVTAISAHKGTTSSTSDNPSALTISSSEDWQVWTISITPAAGGSPPAFSVAPTVSSTTNTSYTLSATADSSSTWYAVAVNVEDGAPTCTQIKAGQNDAGASALGSANKAVTGADTLVVGSLVHPHHDLHSCLNNANGDSAVSSLTSEVRAVDSGQGIFVLTSISATSVFDTDTYYDPDVAVNDIVEADLATNEDGFVVSWQVDGDFSYPDTCGGCRQSIDYCVQDASVDDGDFTTPDCWATDDIIWVNNSAPFANPYGPLVLDISVAMTSLDVCAEFTDADSDALTLTVTGGTLPTGLSIGGTGNCTLSGTPSVEDEAGAEITFTATDIASDTGTMTMEIYVIDTITMPTLTDSDLDASLADELASFPWRDPDPLQTASFKCSTAEASQQILSQTPAASTEVEADQAITVVVSTGDTCARRRMDQ
jgi:hypothetical protein